MAATDRERTVYGPYYRLASDTQTPDVMVKQLLGGELHGEKGRYGLEPAAKAYLGPLPEGEEGFEFCAFDRPDGAHGKNGGNVRQTRLSMAIENSPSAATFSPRWWPSFRPAGGHEAPYWKGC